MTDFRYLFATIIPAVLIATFELGRRYPTEQYKNTERADKILICVEAQLNTHSYMTNKESSLKSCDEIVDEYEGEVK